MMGSPFASAFGSPFGSPFCRLAARFKAQGKLLAAYPGSCDAGSRHDVWGRPGIFPLDFKQSPCAHYNGTDDYVRISAPEFFKDSEFEIRLICSWETLSSERGYYVMPFRVRSDPSVSGQGSQIYCVCDASDTIRFIVINSVGTLYSIPATFPVEKGKVYDILFKATQTDISLFIDGDLEETRSWSGQILQVTTNFNLGDYQASYRHHGKIIYFAHKSNGRLNCEYILAESDGSTIYDTSGNGNHLSITTSDLLAFWGSTQDVQHLLPIRGFNKSGNIYIPASVTDPGNDVLGNPLTHKPNTWNDAPTQYEMRDRPCATFDGIDDYGRANLPDVAGVFRPLKLIFYPLLTDSVSDIIFYAGDGWYTAGTTQFLVFIRDTGITIEARDTDSTNFSLGFSGNHLNTLCVLEVWFDDTTMYARLNGIEKSRAFTPTSEGIIDRITIASSRSFSLRFNGKVIFADYDDVAKYHFNEGHGPTIIDHSGNDHDLTITSSDLDAFWANRCAPVEIIEQDMGTNFWTNPDGTVKRVTEADIKALAGPRNFFENNKLLVYKEDR